jgi:hypothetical protein
MKNIPTFEEFVNESFNYGLYEGHMANLDILAQEAKDFADFEKTAYKEYPQLKKNKDVEEWLKLIYDQAVNEVAEELPGAVHMKLGPKQGRVVISGINTEKYQTDIISAVMAIDNAARLDFFAKTNKIVGVIAVSKLKDIKKALLNIDKSLEAEIKKKPTLTKI